MIVTMHLCMPQGESMRRQFSRYLNEVKNDNRRVVAAMLRAGQYVPDTVGELGLQYRPETHQVGVDGEPRMNLYGMRAMVERGTFSCGDAAAYEAAVVQEKYGHETQCLAVAQGDDDMHAVFVTRDRVIDPTANFLRGRRDAMHGPRVEPMACTIEDGRVVCNEEPECCVDERGMWSCPAVPGLSGRQENITGVQGAPASRWARTASGAVVPVCRPRRFRR